MINPISKQSGIPIEAVPAKQNIDQSAVSASNSLNTSGIATTLETQNAAEFERLQKAVQSAVGKLTDIEAAETNVTFSIHKETKMLMIKVEDANTGKTIREFPPEEVLDSAAQIMQSMGLFVDHSA